MSRGRPRVGHGRSHFFPRAPRRARRAPPPIRAYSRTRPQRRVRQAPSYGRNACDRATLRVPRIAPYPSPGVSRPDAAAVDVDAAPVVHGRVTFSYVLLNATGGGIFAAPTCAAAGDAGVAGVRLHLGNDTNVNDVLDDDEIASSAEVDCDQLDANGDGAVVASEFGNFDSSELLPGTYDHVAIELVTTGALVSWSASSAGVATAAPRATFAMDLTVTAAPAETQLTFPGDEFQIEGELQAFIPTGAV